MRPKSLSRPIRRHQILTVAIALTLLCAISVAHAWLLAHHPGRGVASLEEVASGATAGASHRDKDDVPDFGDDRTGLFERLEQLKKRVRRTVDRQGARYQPAHLSPPPKPFKEPPSYDPAEVRPTRKVHRRPAPWATTSTTTPAQTSTSAAPDRSDETLSAEREDGLEDPSTAVSFFSALDDFYKNLLIEDVKGNPEQPSRSFTDINGTQGKGVALPFDPTFVEEEANWQACDARDASFTTPRDTRCQAYLANLNNMRYIKAMPSRLLQGRTIKMKIYYAHNNIQTIVKIAQRKFTYEAVSEYLAFTYDRALEFNRVPTTVFLPLPVDYLRAATSYSPLLSQWFHRFVVLYNYTNANFEPCTYFGSENRNTVVEDDGNRTLCSMVTSQLWMKDVHPALETFLGLSYEFDEAFVKKYYVPGHESFAGTKHSRLRAVGELLDRSIFDFIIGNTDRGMNDHNNFVYGGCSKNTECTVEKPSMRIKGLAKYAYLDHGSSFHSHKEALESPFFGDMDKIKICRYRKSTSDHLRAFQARTHAHYPLFGYVDARLPVSIYRVAHESVLRKTQARLEKVLKLIDRCLSTYPEDIVFSLPEYNQIRIAEEDETLPEDWDE